MDGQDGGRRERLPLGSAGRNQRGRAGGGALLRGSPAIGEGFGIPVILRYVLETCATTADACVVLGRVPSHMAYNVSVVDRSGAHAVAYLRPDAETEIVHEAVSTNHQRRIEWPEYVSRTGSVERKSVARAALRETTDTSGLVERFLAPPLFVTDYEGWHGTLYTIAYLPAEGAAHVHWRGASVAQRIDDFTEREFDVPYHPRGR